MVFGGVGLYLGVADGARLPLLGKTSQCSVRTDSLDSLVSARFFFPAFLKRYSRFNACQCVHTRSDLVGRLLFLFITVTVAVTVTVCCCRSNRGNHCNRHVPSQCRLLSCRVVGDRHRYRYRFRVLVGDRMTVTMVHPSESTFQLGGPRFTLTCQSLLN